MDHTILSTFGIIGSSLLAFAAVTIELPLLLTAALAASSATAIFAWCF
jgi:hypothetical protein